MYISIRMFEFKACSRASIDHAGTETNNPYPSYVCARACMEASTPIHARMHACTHRLDMSLNRTFKRHGLSVSGIERELEAGQHTGTDGRGITLQSKGHL